MISSGIRSPRNGHSADMEERAALVRVAVLCRLLVEALDELDAETPMAHLVDELTALREHAESELSQSAQTPH
jgi:hypothetical protein